MADARAGSFTDFPAASSSHSTIMSLSSALRHHRWPVIVLSLITAMAAAWPLSFPGAQERPANPDEQGPRLPVVRIDAGMHVIHAELAESVHARATGLMGRQALGPNEGMLFVFDYRDTHCFWMRNTPLPLSIAFIADDGRIVDIEDMQPESDDSHCPGQAVRYALEMEQGWFALHGLGVGDVLRQTGRFGPDP